MKTLPSGDGPLNVLGVPGTAAAVAERLFTTGPAPELVDGAAPEELPDAAADVLPAAAPVGAALAAAALSVAALDYAAPAPDALESATRADASAGLMVVVLVLCAAATVPLEPELAGLPRAIWPSICG